MTDDTNQFFQDTYLNSLESSMNVVMEKNIYQV